MARSLLVSMTESDINSGVKLMVAVSHDLKAKLRRVPSHAEIKWVTASELERRWPSITRRAAMRLTEQLMDVIRLTYDNNQE